MSAKAIFRQLLARTKKVWTIRRARLAGTVPFGSEVIAFPKTLFSGILAAFSPQKPLRFGAALSFLAFSNSHLARIF